MLGNAGGTFQAEVVMPRQVEATTVAAANLSSRVGADLVAGMGLRVCHLAIFPSLGAAVTPCDIK